MLDREFVRRPTHANHRRRHVPLPADPSGRIAEPARARAGVKRILDVFVPRSDPTAGTPHASTAVREGGGVIVKRPVPKEQLKDLLYQALETEIGGVQIYNTALQCAVNEDLARE